jgi:hypothetical protein
MAVDGVLGGKTLFSVAFGPSSGSQQPGHGTELAYGAAIDGFWPIIAAGDNSDQGPTPDGRSVVV